MPAVELTVDVALATRVDRVPTGPGWAHEAKLDGWRSIVRTGVNPRVFSRHGSDLTHAFADIADEVRLLDTAVLDGELVALLEDGTVAFGRLQSRSGRGPRSGADFRVVLVAFDVLSVGDHDLRRRPYRERRERLLDLLQNAPALIQPVPMTTDPTEALAWVGAFGGGIEGCVSKPLDSPYRAGRTASGWLKYRASHTTEAIVIGVTGRTPATQALVLGRPDRRGRVRAVGVSLPAGAALRRELAPLLRPVEGATRVRLPGTVGGLPGSEPVVYTPVRADVVVEIEVDHDLEWGRYRHRPRILRIRADLDPTDLEP
ncbi:ATP-dependent DNA ligase [Embleya sp. NPDC005971]|uniref:ATP-dependent DNA ligase n=1 Tax=Embleya sp. NPDC005971 TaxID=3156724 RepID=UPI0033FA4527